MPLPQRGDEGALYQSFSDQLVRTVRGAVKTSLANVEDACAFAWMQFLRYQPDRDRNWRSWLTRTAIREATKLHVAERDKVYYGFIEPDNPDRRVAEPADPREPQALHLEVGEALALLSGVPERRRQVAVLRLAGFRVNEIADIVGVSRTRADALLSEANAAMNQGRYERHIDPSSPPRVLRLSELERQPPAWLTSIIGRPPGASQPTTALAWRRAALAIDDYRAHCRLDALPAGLGERPAEPASAVRYDRARHHVERLREARAIGRYRGRER